MNEEAIKSLKYLLRHATLYNDVSDAIRAAIDDLENEHDAEEARQLTLCQSDGAILTSCPAQYRCVWCHGTWFETVQPPVCAERKGRAYRPSNSVWVYTA